MQHHPLGKASRKLHKSARDRANRVIGAMLNWPNQKGKPTFRWQTRAPFVTETSMQRAPVGHTDVCLQRS